MFVMTRVFISMFIEVLSILMGGAAINKYIDSDEHPIVYALLQAVNGAIGIGLYLFSLFGIDRIAEKLEERKDK